MRVSLLSDLLNIIENLDSINSIVHLQTYHPYIKGIRFTNRHRRNWTESLPKWDIVNEFCLIGNVVFDGPIGDQGYRAFFNRLITRDDIGAVEPGDGHLAHYQPAD